MAERLRKLLLFPVFAAVASGIGALIWRLLEKRQPDGTAILGLTVLGFICLLFGFWGSDLLRRIQKIGPGGVELRVWEEIGRIPELAEPPRPQFDTESEPWDRQDFTPQQRWFYERGSSLLFHLDHLGVTASSLEGSELTRYRRLVLWIGFASLNEREDYKALAVLKSIEGLPDLNYDELYCLATAFLWVALAEQDRALRKEELRRSAELFERAIGIRSNQAFSRWALGFVYDEMGLYDQAIAQDREAIRLDPIRFHPWAGWNIAVSLLKKGQRAEALDTLAEIREGDWWNQICKDRELAPLMSEARFQEFCQTRRKVAPSG